MQLGTLYSGSLIRRYQRFLADVELESGEIITAHCPNSGSMKGCNQPGSPVLLSRSERVTRKLKFTWELVCVDGFWVGINTLLSNRLVREAIDDWTIPELQGYEAIRTEVPYGVNSRIDLLLRSESRRCFVEVKNVTLVQNGRALFPDAVTTRGQKHMRELMEVVRQGERGVVFFAVQHGGAQSVAPADTIDPEYGRLLREAAAAGVEVLAYRASVKPGAIHLSVPLPVVLD